MRLVEASIDIDPAVLSALGMNVSMTGHRWFGNVIRVGLPIPLVIVTVGLAYSQAMAANQHDSGKNAPGRSQHGFLFIEGRYVPPPYVIQLDGDTLNVNGYQFSEQDLDLSEYEDEIAHQRPSMGGPGGMPGRRQAGRFGRRSPRWAIRPERSKTTPLQMFYGQLQPALLYHGDVIVLFANRPMLALEQTREGQELLKALTPVDARLDRQSEIPPTLTSLPERETWVRLVSEFQPTDAFVARATAQVENIKMVGESNERSSAAALWLDRIAYPLTIFAMVVVVFAFGHLLSNKPYVETSGEDAAGDSETRLAVTRSLLIVGLLSIVDLVWTIAAGQTSSMRELNPLGSQLIDNPLQLVLFKTTITAIAIGLLYKLHRSPIAQLGSWWSCLVLTLLTARWLTFHSMFL